MKRRKNYRPKKKRTIDLYTFVYNDEDILPFFLDYYNFVDRMTFIDSGSNDSTIDIINEYAKKGLQEIRVAQTGLEWWDWETLHRLKNNIWKGSVYDLVFFPDCDEILYHPDIISFLNEYPYDIYEMTGFEMVAPSLPQKGLSILNINKGKYFQMYNKSTIFNPKINIEFLNAHIRYAKTTNVSIGQIKLLHYRNMGIELMKKRRDREQSRLPIGCKYRIPDSDETIKNRYDSLMLEAIKVI